MYGTIYWYFTRHHFTSGIIKRHTFQHERTRFLNFVTVRIKEQLIVFFFFLFFERGSTIGLIAVASGNTLMPYDWCIRVCPVNLGLTARQINPPECVSPGRISARLSPSLRNRATSPACTSQFRRIYRSDRADILPNTNDDPLQPDGGSYEIANDRPVIRFSASRRFYATERKREKERERERERIEENAHCYWG